MVDSKHSSQTEVSNELLNEVRYLINKAYKAVFSNPQQCLELSRKALRLSAANNFKTGMGVAFLHVGIGYYYLDDLNRAMKCYNHAYMVLINEKNTDKFLEKIWNNRGIIYYQWDNQLEALQCFKNSLAKIDPEKDHRGFVYGVNNIANCGTRDEDIDELQDLYFLAYRLSVRHRVNEMKGITCNNISRIYLLKSDTDKALEWSKKAINYKTRYPDKKNLMECYENRSLIYQKMKKYSKAIAALQQVEQLAREINSQIGLSAAYALLARCYPDDKRTSLRYLVKAKNIAEKAGLTNQRLNVTRLLYEHHKSAGNHKKALAFYEEFVEAKEKKDLRAYKAEKDNSIQLINLQQKEKERAALHKKNRIIEKKNHKIEAQKKILTLNQERYDQLAEQSGSFIWEVDKEGFYTYLNRSAEEVIGYKPKELIDKKHFFDLCPEEDREALKEYGFRVMRDVTLTDNKENRLVRKDGKVIWVMSNGACLTDENGEFVGYRGIDQDITERKEMEMALKKTNRELKTAYEELKKAEDELLRLERKNAVWATIVTANHEINQPLMIIQGNLELLQMKLDDPRYNSYFDVIQRALSRIEGIIKKLGKIEDVKMITYLDEVKMLKLDEDDE